MSGTNIWPRYAGLGDRTFVPLWFLQSADELAAQYGDTLRTIDVQFWGVAEYNDNTHVERKACTCFVWEGFNKQPSEDDLDHVPAVRRMERRAADLWDHIPIVLDSEVDITGEFSFTISPQELLLDYDDWRDVQLTARAAIDGDEWRYVEKISFFPKISETARATLCVENALEEIDFGPEWDHDKIPKPIAVEWDDDCLTVTFDGGFFAAYKAEGE